MRKASSKPAAIAHLLRTVGQYGRRLDAGCCMVSLVPRISWAKAGGCEMPRAQARDWGKSVGMPMDWKSPAAGTWVPI